MRLDRWARSQQAFQKENVLYKGPLKSLKWWNGVVRLAFSKPISGCQVANELGRGPDWRQEDFAVLRWEMVDCTGVGTEAVERRSRA